MAVGTQVVISARGLAGLVLRCCPQTAYAVYVFGHGRWMMCWCCGPSVNFAQQLL